MNFLKKEIFLNRTKHYIREVNIVLLADDMLKSLSEMEKSGNYKRDNDDFNFGEVLKFYSDGSVDKSKYVNEQHKNYSSDD